MRRPFLRMIPPLALLTLVVVASAVLGAALELYDDFSGSEIDPSRWQAWDHSARGWDNSGGRPISTAETEGTDDSTWLGGDNLERRWAIVSDELHLGLVTSGDIENNSDWSPGRGRLGVRMADRSLRRSGVMVRRLQARTTVTRMTWSGCPDDAYGWWRPYARVQVHGVFFNNGESTEANDLTGDVFATLSLVRSLADGAQSIHGSVRVCFDASCEWSTKIPGISEIGFERSWTEDTPHTLTIQWQPDQNRFRFTVGGDGAPAETVIVTYPAEWAENASRQFTYDLRIENEPGNCWIPPAFGIRSRRPRARTDVRFDDVKIER